MKLIDKDALVAKIQRMQDAYIAKLESRGMGHEEAVMASISYVNGIKDVVNSLEVKEVDLEKEIDDAFLENKCNITDNVSLAEFVRIAKHFFELGLQAATKGGE